MSELDLEIPSNIEYLVIDGDSIPYMIGWHHREHEDEQLVRQAVNQFIKDFLLLAGLNKYIGVLAAPKSRCYRYDLYKYKPYKGNRGEAEDWLARWKPVIVDELVSTWRFVYAPEHLETDDVVATLVEGNTKAMLCSPDKDLKQVAGYHLNFKGKSAEEDRMPLTFEAIGHSEAERILWKQVLTGDSTDNINGLTGMGSVKADKLLSETMQFAWKNEIALAFQKQYGPFYGPVIFEETYHTVRLMTPSHPLWETHGFDVESYKSFITEYAGPVYPAFEREESL